MKLFYNLKKIIFRWLNLKTFVVAVLIWMYYKQLQIQRLLRDKLQEIKSEINRSRNAVKIKQQSQDLRVLEILLKQESLLKSVEAKILLVTPPLISEPDDESSIVLESATLVPMPSPERNTLNLNLSTSSSQVRKNGHGICEPVNSDKILDIYTTAFAHNDGFVTGMVTVAISKVLTGGKNIWYNKHCPDRGHVFNNIYAQKVVLDSVFHNAVGVYKKIRIFSVVNTKKNFSKLNANYATRFRKTVNKYTISNVELEFRITRSEGPTMKKLTELFEEFKVRYTGGLDSKDI